jgi:hypothetical protein
MKVYFQESFHLKRLNILTLVSFLLITCYIVTENFFIKINLFQTERILAKTNYRFNFKDSQSKEKCDSIYLNLYKLHSTKGSHYPKENVSLYDSNLYKSFNSERLDNVQIKNIWLVDADFKEITSENKKTQTFVSNKNILEVGEFISTSNYYDSSYFNHQGLIKMLRKYLNITELSKKNVASFGFYEQDYIPWVETIFYKMNNQSKLKIIDYKRKEYENINFEWIPLVNFLHTKYEKSIMSSSLLNQYQEFDIIISHHNIDKVRFN